MNAFIGTKIILAEEMSKEEFDFRMNNLSIDRFDNSIELPELQQCTPGYHVQYSNPGSNKNYDSWSPKDVFERSYRKIETDEKELISNN